MKYTSYHDGFVRVSFPRGIQFLLEVEGSFDGIRVVYQVVTQNSNFEKYRPRPRATEPPERVVVVRMQASTRIHGS